MLAAPAKLFFSHFSSCLMNTNLALRKDLRCSARPKFFGDAAVELINQRDGWLRRSVTAKVHMCDPGQGDRTRLHLNSFSGVTHTHTRATVGELAARFAPHPFCSCTLATYFVYVRLRTNWWGYGFGLRWLEEKSVGRLICKEDIWSIQSPLWRKDNPFNDTDKRTCVSIWALS